MEFLDVFNAAAQNAVYRADDIKDATNYDQEPADLGIDSLDMIMVVAILTDAYGIPDDLEFDNVSRVTVGTVRDFVDEHKTQEPESLEEVREAA